MKKQILKSGVYLIAGAFMASSIFFTGCNKPDGPAPEIPASSSMEMEFNTFPKDGQRSNPDSTDKDNFVHSAANILVWNIVLTVNLAVPVAAFKEALNHEAEWDKDVEKWNWSYSVSVAGKVYTANLYGKINGDKVNWEMYVSQNGGFQDFLWYTGESKTDGTGGTWSLNKDANNPTAFIGIEWTKNANGTGDIKYTNVIPGDAGNGGYIKYGITSNADFNAFYDIYNKAESNTTNITWNRTTKVGKVMDPKKFGDSEWHCWDENLANSVCN